MLAMFPPFFWEGRGGGNKAKKIEKINPPPLRTLSMRNNLAGLLGLAWLTKIT